MSQATLQRPAETTIPTVMGAVAYDDYGDPSVLRYRDLPTPKASGEQLLIQVEAAGVNPIDARLRSGEMRYLMPGGFPRIPGYDVAGRVISAPPSGPFREGDRVLGFLDHLFGGGYAQHATCGVDAAAKIPETMPIEQAAALPLAGSTALQALVSIGRLTPGQSVLINGASGGVGAFAVQIAAKRNAEVTAVASGKNESFVRDLGAGSFVDYGTTRFTDLGRHWDLIFDVAGRLKLSDVKSTLTEQGHFISTEPNLKGFVNSVLTRPRSKRASVVLARPRAEDLARLVELYVEGHLAVTLDSTFPLHEAADAHRRLEAGVERGKIVLTVKH